MNKEFSTFGERLKQAFDNESNVAIASKLGVSKSNITFYMQGKIPPAEKLIEIARLTNCNLNWLLTGEGSKKNNHQIDRPAGIILQGSKGGVGTSTSAVLIASALAFKGYKILLAGDEYNTCLNILSLNQPLSVLAPGDIPKTKITSNSYIKTKNKNLDFFIPQNWRINDFPDNHILPFEFDYSAMNKKYDFVIFDTSIHANPFHYPYEQVENFPLEPILRDAKILIPYDPIQSTLQGVEIALEYLERERSIYPKAGFLGIFLFCRRSSVKFENEKYEFKLEELRKEFTSKIFDTRIEYHPEIRNAVSGIQKYVYSRRTQVSLNFSQLVEEMLKKI